MVTGLDLHTAPIREISGGVEMMTRHSASLDRAYTCGCLCNVAPSHSLRLFGASVVHNIRNYAYIWEEESPSLVSNK